MEFLKEKSDIISMMKMLKIAVILSIIASGFAVNAASLAKLTIKVVDEAGNPVRDADASITFNKMATVDWGYEATTKKGKTDDNGLFSAEGEQLVHDLYYATKKEGYYSSGGEFIVERLDNDRWQPWNPTISMILKKKRNPSAMYAQRTDWIKIPSYDMPVGYDLEVGDWVAPFGKGAISDFVFVAKNKYRDWNDYESSYTLKFSNPHDGIQEYEVDENEHSSYRWPFEAPETGYVSELKRFSSSNPGEPIKKNLHEEGKINYIFRVRTKVDKDGKVIEARYGKIKGEIVISKKGNLNFLYFFNPDGTRNLEFDHEKNLFIPAKIPVKQRKNYKKYKVWD